MNFDVWLRRKRYRLCLVEDESAFASKAALVIEEADESGFWLEFLVKVELAGAQAVQSLRTEANELGAIFTASRKTLRARLAPGKKGRETQNAERQTGVIPSASILSSEF